MYLMYMGATVLELRCVTRQLMLNERSRGAFEREIDLPLDPGQRAQIEFGCGVHSLSRISLNRP